MIARPERQSRQTYRKPLDAVHEAMEYGIDVAAIRDNLALSPAERLRRHDSALNLVEALRKAKFV